MKPTGNDHRTRVTRMLIRKAFTELLRQKPIQDISIRELCAAAGINRGTFYLHYKDIYDLRDQIEEEMMADFQKALSPLLETAQDVSPVKITTGIFQCLKDNADLCTVTLGDYGDKAFAYRLVNTAGKNALPRTPVFSPPPHQSRLSFSMPLSAPAVLGCCRSGLPREWPPVPRRWPRWRRIL